MERTFEQVAKLASTADEAAFCRELPQFVLLRKHKPRPSWGGSTRVITNRTRMGEVKDELFSDPKRLELILPPVSVPGVPYDLAVGRLADNDIVLDEDSVSLHHALFKWDGRLLTVTDFTSTNGVSLNGVVLDAATDVPVDDGDVLSLGQVHLRFFTAPGLYRALHAATAK